jgi:hypothetical protein
MFEEQSKKIADLADNLKAYVQNRIEKVSRLIADILAVAIVFFIASFFILLASMALAFALGRWLNDTALGFLIVSLLYALLGILVWAKRDQFLRIPILNALIKSLFNKDEDEKEKADETNKK